MADDSLADVGLPDAHRRIPFAGASIMPSLIANGPTAVVRLPQLPDQSITGASIATWPKTSLRVSPRVRTAEIFNWITAVLRLKTFLHI